jgi:anhydro-N-acetylmuramic acid kinase
MRWTIGLMSGTSMDGIDAAVVRTDGRDAVTLGAALTVPYTADFRGRLRDVLGGGGAIAAVERELTLLHADAVRALLAEAGLEPAEVGLIGFHGHTVLHEPERRRTWQIGDGGLLARELGIDVVADFRSHDVEAGGQGAPLAPLYHAALAAGLETPLAVLNLGGVGNVTWIGPGRETVIAFDTGPGNALLDDWVEARGHGPCDRDGRIAAAGRIDRVVLEALLAHPYFDRSAPKSLDRDAFDVTVLGDIGLEDGAATLAAFTVETVTRAAAHLPVPPLRWLVTGGGRRNPLLMTRLAERLGTAVDPVEAVDWNGDMLEAQAFAWLARRSVAGLPLSLPTTTGVPQPMTGGVLHRGGKAA